MLIGAFAIVLASFFITLKGLDYWGPEGKQIRVTEAAYGQNCPPQQWHVSAKPENASAAVSGACNGKASCEFNADPTFLSDPVPGCGKDFTVSWRCGAFGAVHQINVASEVDKNIFTHKVVLSCPAR